MTHGYDSPTPLDIVLDELVIDDIDIAMALDARTAPAPWTPGVWRQELLTESTRSYRAASIDNQMVGFSGAMYLPDETHVTTIAVEPAFHRRGVASALLADLLWRGLSRGFNAFSLEVRPTNTPARQLYQKFGFVPAGVRRHYYPDNGEDALVMWLDDAGSEEYRERLTTLDPLATHEKKAWKL